jgi:hypothetical protein
VGIEDIYHQCIDIVLKRSADGGAMPTDAATTDIRTPPSVDAGTGGSDSGRVDTGTGTGSDGSTVRDAGGSTVDVTPPPATDAGSGGRGGAGSGGTGANAGTGSGGTGANVEQVPVGRVITPVRAPVARADRAPAAPEAVREPWPAPVEARIPPTATAALHHPGARAPLGAPRGVGAARPRPWRRDGDGGSVSSMADVSWEKRGDGVAPSR